MVMNKAWWAERIEIWAGLEGFKPLLVELFTLGINNINQQTLDQYLPHHKLRMETSKKSLALKALEEQKRSLDPQSDLYAEIISCIQNLQTMEDEINLQKSQNSFQYDLVLKEAGFKAKNLVGFVKIINPIKTNHRALLSWQKDSRDPILFLTELIGDKLFFHINLGVNDGLAIIEEVYQGYRWTHCLESEYSQMIEAEFGSIFMDKLSQKISLETDNIAAAAALSKAQTRNAEGVTVLENNIELMKLYKEDLSKMDFFF